MQQISRAPRRLVINKSDLPAAWALEDWRLVEADSAEPIHVSAKTGEGLDALRNAIADETSESAGDRDAPAISNMRHIALLDVAARALDRLMESLAVNATEEMLLVDLGEARQALEEVRGRRAPDELLHHIFSRFCIGK